MKKTKIFFFKNLLKSFLIALLICLNINLFAQWEQIYKFQPIYNDIDVYFYTKDSLIFLSDYNDSVMFSSNYGEKWRVFQSLKGNHGIYINDSIITYGNRSQIFVSSDYLKTLDSIKNIGVIQYLIDRNYIYANTGDRFVISKDFGKTWDTVRIYDNLTAPCQTPHCTYGYYTHANLLKINNGILYADMSSRLYQYGSPIGIDDRGLHYSSDYGKTWKKYNISAEMLEFSGSTMFAYSDKILYKSIDNGSTWIKILNAGLFSFKVIGNKIIGVNYTSFYVSNDGGNSWGISNIDQKFIQIEISNNYIYICSVSGDYFIIFRKPIDQFTNIQTEESGEFKIYPNPLKQGNELNISFPSNIKSADISIYNTMGALVKHLNSNSGSVYTNDLQKGFYILSIRTKDNLYSKQLIIK